MSEGYQRNRIESKLEVGKTFLSSHGSFYVLISKGSGRAGANKESRVVPRHPRRLKVKSLDSRVLSAPWQLSVREYKKKRKILVEIILNDTSKALRARNSERDENYQRSHFNFN